MKRVAVTGAAGFLGSNLVIDLIRKGFEVFGVDNLSTGSLNNLEKVSSDSRFFFLEMDVVDKKWIDAVDAPLDLVVHFAAKKIPRYGGTLDTLNTNYFGAVHSLELAKRDGVKCVLASTSDVYGLNPELPFSEEKSRLVMGSSKAARWSYAVSKLFEEHLALAYQDEFGFPVTLLRFFGAYGPHQKLSWLGGPPPVFIEKVLKDEVIPIHGDGLQTRTFTYVDDTIRGVVAACFSPNADGELLNIGSREEVTILELARRVHKACGKEGEPKIELIPYETFTGKLYEDVRRRVPDNTLCKKLLGVEAEVSLDEGLKRTIAWQRVEMGL